MKTTKGEIEHFDHSKQPVPYGVTLALVSTIICAGKPFKFAVLLRFVCV